MARNHLGYNVNLIRLDEKDKRELENLNKRFSKTCKSQKDRELLELGYNTKMAGKPIPEEYKDSGVFKSGYDWATRILNLKEDEKNKQIISEMVANNIPFEEAPENIKNNDLYKTHYLLCSIKHNKTKSGKTK